MCASWPLGSLLLEYIYALLSLGPFIFGMPGILSPILGPSTDPGVGLGGITSLYHAHSLGVVTFIPLLGGIILCMGFKSYYNCLNAGCISHDWRGLQHYYNVDFIHIITLYPCDPKEILHILLVSNDTRLY